MWLWLIDYVYPTLEDVVMLKWFPLLAEGWQVDTIVAQENESCWVLSFLGLTALTCVSMPLRCLCKPWSTQHFGGLWTQKWRITWLRRPPWWGHSESMAGKFGRHVATGCCRPKRRPGKSVLWDHSWGWAKNSEVCHHETHLFLILHYLHSAQHCFCQLLFLLLLLMVNYQDSVEQRQGRLLHSAVRHTLHSAPRGLRNLTSLRE